MEHDLTYHEKRLTASGYPIVAGVDEAGRGALAGPLVAAAVILPNGFNHPEIRDSKQLTSAKREELYEDIVSQALDWSVAYVLPSDIDSCGLQLTNVKALRDAVLALKMSLDYVLSDGYDLLGIDTPYEVLIKGDRRSLTIAAASIIAKVTRDMWMHLYHHAYPKYGFDSHKGYGTEAHSSALRTHGASPIHRVSFRPVAEAIREEADRLEEERRRKDIFRAPRGGSSMFLHDALRL